MLSIVIPTKNEETYLPVLLKSIREQSQQPLEVIVADAWSTDKTRQIAESFDCVVVDGGMPGPGRNRGAEVAKGEFVLFLDADVELIDKDFIKHALAELQTRKLDFATCDSAPQSAKWSDKFFFTVYNGLTRTLAAVHPYAPGYCLFAKTEMHRQLHGFDESIVFCEDTEYARRATRIGKFRVLRSIQIPVSVRRFDRDGVWQSIVRYSLAEVYMVTMGPIRTNIFNYTFGHNKKS